MTAAEMLTAALAASNLIEYREDTDDRVWDLVCRYEDGDETIWADARALSDDDRILLQSETAIVDAQRLVAAQYRPAARPAVVGISCPGRGPDYEGRILAEAERRYYTA